MDLVGTMKQNWIEECANEVGLYTYLPLWQINREFCQSELSKEGFKIIFTCVKSPWFDETWIGRTLDQEALAEMRDKVTSHDLDLGGERGEYHTMCLDGPLYKKAIVVKHAGAKLLTE